MEIIKQSLVLIINSDGTDLYFARAKIRNKPNSDGAARLSLCKLDCFMTINKNMAIVGEWCIIQTWRFRIGRIFFFFLFSFLRDTELNLGCAAQSPPPHPLTPHTTISTQLSSSLSVMDGDSAPGGKKEFHLLDETARQQRGAKMTGRGLSSHWKCWVKMAWLGLSRRSALSDAEGKKNQETDEQDCW